MKCIFKVILLTLLVHNCVGPPAAIKHSEKTNEVHHSEEESDNEMEGMGLEYDRYLREVVEALESDHEFARKLKDAEEHDLKNGKVAAELDKVNHHVRTKLDELKRTELNRLKEYAKKVHEENSQLDPSKLEHLDHYNPHSFESADLQKLINKVAADLSAADQKRREEFKQYELEKHFEEQQKLKSMDEKEKEEFLKEIENRKKKHAEHEPLHHPGSRAQLEEVWEKQDHMENQEFNPKTFFHLHDLDSNGFWDEQEVKVLFRKELDKMYQAGAPEDDMKEREEEMERMREHVFKEADTNRDQLISYEEFLEQTKSKEFQRDEGWESLDQQQFYTQQEYEEYERRRQQEIQRMIDSGMIMKVNDPYPHYHWKKHNIHGHPEHSPHGHPPHVQYHPGYGHPNEIPHGYHPQAVHPNQYPQGHYPPGAHPGQGGHPQAQYPQQGMHPAQYQSHPGAMAPQGHPPQPHPGNQQYQGAQQQYQAPPQHHQQQQYQHHQQQQQQQYPAPGAHPGSPPQYQAPQAPGAHPGSQQQYQAPGAHPGSQQQYQAPGAHPGSQQQYQAPQAPVAHPGSQQQYQAPQAPGAHSGNQPQFQAPPAAGSHQQQYQQYHAPPSNPQPPHPQQFQAPAQQHQGQVPQQYHQQPPQPQQPGQPQFQAQSSSTPQSSSPSQPGAPSHPPPPQQPSH